MCNEQKMALAFRNSGTCHGKCVKASDLYFHGCFSSWLLLLPVFGVLPSHHCTEMQVNQLAARENVYNLLHDWI